MSRVAARLRQLAGSALESTRRRVHPVPDNAGTRRLSTVAGDFPGAKAEFTSQLHFQPAAADRPLPCFQVLDFNGSIRSGAEEFEVGREVGLEVYRRMVQLQVMDGVLYEAQRQGRISFYLTSTGEEAVTVAAAAGLSDEDHVFAQYREAGVLMWRGYSMTEFADQCVGNEAGHGRGRQMPIHYGSAALRYHTISSPLATQIPHAVGAAYSLKVWREACCSAVFFGDGAASEGDFHAALNFAAVLETPVLFICRNNGWAISTPAKEQYKGDGIAGRGQGYGVQSVRVDGNDALAVLAAVREARAQVVTESRPILLEALTYRTGHHSTSDDSSRYRGASEIAHWRTERDPTVRMRRWVSGKGWWDDAADAELRESTRREVISALEAAEKLPKPPLSAMFRDVYDDVPLNLREQAAAVADAARRSPSSYPRDVTIDTDPRNLAPGEDGGIPPPSEF